MYKVLVVDDEPIVRLAIKSLVNWEEQGFSFDFEAANGKQALKIFEENTGIDIVITDINMPVMDGLELISEIKKMNCFPIIIVLSAYNDYSFIRRAFKLGVKDYILKTEMEPENILNLLKELVSKVDLNRFASSPLTGILNDQESKFVKENFLRELIENRNIPDLKNKIENLGINIGNRNIVVCLLWVDDYQKVSERYDNSTLKSFITSVINAIYQVLNEINTGEAIFVSPQEYVLFLSYNGDSMAQMRERIADTLGKIRHSLINYVNIGVSIGVSPLNSGYENINNQFRQAEANTRLRFVFGKGRTIFPEDARNITGTKSESLIGREARFVAALKEADNEKTMEELDKLLYIIKGFKPDRIETIHAYYMELIFLITKLLSEIGEETEEVFGKEVDFYQKILKFETLEEINIWIKNITAWVINYLNNKKDMGTNRVITRAQEFINNNYSNDLTLKMVSEYVGLSESHFSALFVKRTGESFIDYLTYVRIEAAKSFITSTNMKVYEICTKVGYANVEHFSRVFKKVTGQSPNSFKKI